VKFKIGDKVKFLNESMEGEVIRISSKGRYVVLCEDGFECETMEAKLIESLDFSSEVIVSVVDIAEKGLSYKKKRSNKHVAKRNRGSIYREVNLHIDELLDDHRGMTNSELFNFQISVFKRELDKAIINNERKIIFIHGIGEGVLRDGIRDTILLEYPEVQCYDGSYKEYGFGATEVVIHN